MHKIDHLTLLWKNTWVLLSIANPILWCVTAAASPTTLRSLLIANAVGRDTHIVFCPLVIAATLLTPSPFLKVGYTTSDLQGCCYCAWSEEYERKGYSEDDAEASHFEWGVGVCGLSWSWWSPFASWFTMIYADWFRAKSANALAFYVRRKLRDRARLVWLQPWTRIRPAVSNSRSHIVNGE